MPNAECGMVARPSQRVSTFPLNSAFDIPHPAFGWGGEGSLGGRWHRGASHARTGPSPGPARRGEGNRAAARGRGARDRSAGAATLSVPPPPAPDRADLPARLVEEPALDAHDRPGVARRGSVLDEERPVIVIGTGGYAAGPVVWRAQ